MSVSPSSPGSGQTLGQVLIHRAFASPPRQMVDSELLHALEDAHHSDQQKVAGPEDAARPSVDVRA